MHRQQKIDTVAELKETLSKVASLVLADFRGLTVQEVTGLRSEMRKADCTYRVIKNTLVKRASRTCGRGPPPSPSRSRTRWRPPRSSTSSART